ncbi:hypothetical protein SSX86_027328 [Deinandra increscens subsp. villosa]|uniref:peptidylprolyl isomerase n=1 Tax=Deinandra increscens subsp. villosa TaxID=3103831 RepID=A0AAP0CJW1_9ASTR
MVIELFSDVVPKTAENFRALCTGEKGIGPVTGKPLHYKGTVFYKIDQRLAAEGGDIENRKGRAGGGECIYGNGRYFEDENSERTHERGTLSMALFDSRNSNGSTFILCFRDEFRDLDGCHVVFGKVIKGMEIVTKIEDVGSPKGPIQEVKIENCGELSEDQKSNVMVPDEEMINKKLNPWVYLDISIGEGPVGRMVIELFSDVVPKTAENFRALCTGEKGIGPVTGKPLHYKGTVFYKIDQRLAAEGGDIENKKGRAGGGECIYGNGRYFEDENFERTHERGTLSMALFDRGNTNGSTFILCFRDEFRHLDGCHVVFGKVIKGMEIVTKIEDVGSPKGPIQEVKIENCGELSEDQKSNVMVPDEGTAFLIHKTS